MIIKVVERQFTWKDTGKPCHQYDVYHSTKSSDLEYRDGRPRSFGPHMMTTRYPWGWCRHYVYRSGEIPITVLRFVTDDRPDITVTTEYRECWNSQSGTAKVTTYTVTKFAGGDTYMEGAK